MEFILVSLLVITFLTRADSSFQLYGIREKRQLVLPKDTFVPEVTAPIFTGRRYEYGTEEGDKQLNPEVDSVQLILLAKPIVFYEKSYDFAYIMSNGGVGLELTSNRYVPKIFGEQSAPIIAPFWSRNDLRKGGAVFYREVISGNVLERGEREIRYQYGVTIPPKSALIITWENMQPNRKGVILPPEHTNTFQAAIFLTDNGTFVNFIYSHIGWSLGAKAGFNQGKGGRFHELPSSGTNRIVYLEERGNNGIPGEWIFRVDKRKIIRCKPGIKGKLCNRECGLREWGYDCSECCHCEGKCRGETGQCLSDSCSQCWTNYPYCDEKISFCDIPLETCAANAVSFTDHNICGEPITRCQCQEGFTGDGFQYCKPMPLFWFFDQQAQQAHNRTSS